MKKSNFILVDIDTQFDFMDPQGKLYVPGAEQCVPHLKRLIHTAENLQIPIFSSADAHPLDDPEFENFPPHCIIDTPGQLKIAETLSQQAFIVPQRGLTPPEKQAAHHAAQLILYKNVFDMFSNPNTLSLIKETQAHTAVVCGVATEYCVSAAVQGLLKAGLKVWLVHDAIRGVNTEQAQLQCLALQSAGALCLSTQEVISHWNLAPHHLTQGVTP